jgi:hypothetical protein
MTIGASRALAFSIFLAYCSPTIGNRASLDVSFAPGRTSKDEVANTLGLPAAIKKDDASGLELWAYRESPELTAVQVPMVSAGRGTVLVSAVTYSAATDRLRSAFADAGAVFAFNHEGVLIYVDRPRTKGNKP